MNAGKPEQLSKLKEHYDRLWANASGKLRDGVVEIDPVLHARLPDRRRGFPASRSRPRA
jgi:hypothetical protein